MTFTWRHTPPDAEPRDGPACPNAMVAIMDAVRVHTGEAQVWARAHLTWKHEMMDRGWSLREVRADA